MQGEVKLAPVLIETHYSTLGVHPGISNTELHRRFIELSKLHHPDKGGDEKLFARMTEAYTILKDPVQRVRYDAQLSLKIAPCKFCKGTGEQVKQVNFTHVRKIQCKHCDGTGQQLSR